MARQTYAQRIASFFRRFPGATLSEARGHKKVEHHEIDKKHYLESYQRVTSRTIRGLKPLMPKVKGETDVLLIVTGCASCPSGQEGEEGRCEEMGGYEETQSAWVRRSSIELQIKNDPDMIMTDFADIFLPVQCWQGQNGNWLTVDKVAFGLRKR